MVTHEAAFVNIAVDATETALAGVLPDEVVVAVFQHWLRRTILRYHERIAVHLAGQIFVIEVGAAIDEGFLAVVVFYEFEELEQGVAKLLYSQAGCHLYIDERYEVLLAGTTLQNKICQLRLLLYLRPVKVIGADLQSVLMCCKDVVLILLVDAVAALGGLDIYVCHGGVVGNRLPEYLSRIVGDVDAVDM
jgi:hypothetical protein